MKKKPSRPVVQFKLHDKSRQLLPATLIVAIYLIAFILLDFITRQYQVLPGIVSWYPPAGLTYVLLLVFGVCFTPAVTIALFISSVFVYRMPQPIYLLFLWALIISLLYGALVGILSRVIHLDWQLRKFKDVTRFILMTVLVSAFLSVLSVFSSALSSEMGQDEILYGILQWWIGETIGVLTVTPFLLLHVIPGLKRNLEEKAEKFPTHWSLPHLTLPVIAQAFSLVITLYLVFGVSDLKEFQPLYFITLPLIWISLNHGIKGAAIGIIAMNFGVMCGMSFFQSDLANLGELQLLMIVNCIVGLLMGAVVTERKKAEELLHEYSQNLKKRVEERTRELQDAQELLLLQERLATMGQLAGSVGHELRNPLNVISSSVYLLKKTLTGLDEKSQEYLDIIKQETDICAKIIKDLLDFGRKSIASKVNVKVSVIVSEALARNKPPENISVVSLPIAASLLIMADPQQIGQVLDNLIMNAYQAMPDGGKLTVKAVKQKGRVTISVADTGTGITRKNMNKLFEPLFTTKARGIGLGLALSKNYVEANGGSILVESEENKGSMFTLSFKLEE